MTRCAGSVHTIPVPRAMTPDEAWAEICTMGRIVEPDPDCTWANVICPGGFACECSDIER